jgi:hypothetical protein
MILTGEISFRGGMRTKGMHKSVRRITSARSVGIFRFCILFPGGLKGQKAKGKGQKFWDRAVPNSILNLRAYLIVLL